MWNLFFVYLYMSVALQTKTKVFTAVVLGSLVALSSSLTWASTTPGSIPTVQSNQVAVVSTSSSNQDLSVLRSKLKERFSWVVTEVRSLVDGTTDPMDSFHGSSAVRTIDVSQGIGVKPAIFRQDFFVDIQEDPYKSYINRLAAYGVLSPASKFYPQNYFRVDDFTSLLIKLYRKTSGQTLTAQDVSWIASDDGLMTKRVLQQAMQSLHIGEGIQVDGNPYDKLTRSEWAYFLVRLFDLPVLEVDTSSSLMLPNVFSDTVDHPFAPAISTLASLGIVNTQSTKFYPDNYVRHYDFVLLFVNSLLTANKQALPSLFSSSFADVDSSAGYLPQLGYAADRWLIDYIVTSKQGQLYFYPDNFVTKQEVYQMVMKTLGIVLVYDQQQAAMEKITRAEMAQLLVDVFAFQPKIISESDVWIDLDSEEMSLLTKLRTLLSVL